VAISRRGLRVVITCSTKCSYNGTLTLSRGTARKLRTKSRLATRRGTFGSGGSRASKFKPSAGVRRRLRKATGAPSR